jgi:protein O-mannosyl-transferase
MSRLGAGVRIALTVILLAFSVVIRNAVAAANDQICDVAADFALGQEDYPKAIVLHRRFLRFDPNNALAHYHLGFAYGMVGRTDQEISEYLTAIKLGLHRWDLFLNLGLAYIDEQDLVKAATALERAESVGPQHAEAHFNLALIYERQNRLNKAIREIAIARRLAPKDPDVGNTNAIICAEMGNLACARDIWTDLAQTMPEYAPARVNLALINRAPAATSALQEALYSSRLRKN